MSLRIRGSSSRVVLASVSAGSAGAAGAAAAAKKAAALGGRPATQNCCNLCTSATASATASSTSSTSSTPSPSSLPPPFPPNSNGSRRSSSASSVATAAAVAKSSAPKTAARSNLIRPIRIVPRTNVALAAPALKPPRQTKRQRALDPPSNKPPTPREQQLSRTYALEAVSPPTALAALGNRISPDLLGVRASDKLGKNHEHWAKLLEQCCTCSSFWEVVAEEEALQDSVAQQQREDGGSITQDPNLEKRYTNYLDAERLDNESLSVLGNSLLGTFALEWLENRYPHLPERVIKAALTLYVGPRTCADVASRSWGITAGSASRTAFLGAPPAIPVNSSDKHVPGHPLRGVGEGGRSGMGLLRWGKSAQSALEAVTRRQSETGEREQYPAMPLPLEEALASAARAVVGLVYQEHGFAAVRHFVHAHFLSRQADLLPLLKFFNPRYTLQATMQKHGREAPVTRLIAETGRLSISPIFVMGVWSGTTKLGEGYGSSLKMAEWRACEDALRRIYLSPLENPVKDINDAEKGQEVARLELPTDTLVYPGTKLRHVRPLADEEVLFHSSGRSGVVAR